MFHDKRWSLSALGNPIELHASQAPASLKGENPILLMGGVHGDEPEGVWLARSTLTLLQKEKSPLPWALIPCLNVDGFAKGTRVNGRGVDLNRNYPAKSWAPSFEKERYHPGPSAGSEPETQAVVRLIEEIQPRMIIHCHSWKPCIVFSGEPGRPEAEMLARSSGYALQPEIGYPTPGALSQFGWADRGIPVICIEEEAGAKEADVWPRFAEGMREIFKTRP
ncbi:MAG TPA: M14 family zinc carboxypeptidase [Bdellovibrionota bacterium]|jgi:hypothetical protein